MTAKEKAASIFNEYEEWWFYVNYLIENIGTEEGKNYWIEVKQEIEKLCT
jgi:hypothetical protein